MSSDGKSSSWTKRFWTACLYLFGSIILLKITIQMIGEILWLVIIVAIIVVVVTAIRWWYRIRDGLD